MKRLLDFFWILYYKTKYKKGNICFMELILNMKLNILCSKKVIQKLEDWYIKNEPPEIKSLIKNEISKNILEFEL